MARYGYDGYGWRPYVPVARRRAQAKREMESLRKKGVDIQPVQIEGRKIARTFWGQAWCEHLESFSDYENRLPRGRTYVRNGSVCHLEIKTGEVLAQVMGSELYDLRITIKPLSAKKWKDIKQRCAGQVGSLLELLQGKLSDHVMQTVTDRKDGLFPRPAEISLSCDCPDWATMCKHVAAALYGVGARLDQQPELLFKLRGVDHQELIDANAEAAVSAATTRGKAKRLAADALGDVFGIELDAVDKASGSPPAKKAAAGRRGAKRAKKKSPAKKAVAKRTTSKGTAAKKPAAKKPAAKKPAAKKTAVKKTGAKKPAKAAVTKTTRTSSTTATGKSTAKPAAKKKTSAAKKPSRRPK